jgi:hypothetical protein
MPARYSVQVESIHKLRQFNDPLITKDHVLRACHSMASSACTSLQSLEPYDDCFQLYHIPCSLPAAFQPYDRGALPFTKSLYNMNKPVTVHTDIFRACTATDLDVNGRPLTYRTAIRSAHGSAWERAAVTELNRLLSSGTGRFIAHDAMPRNRRAAYYNPVLKIKTKPNGMIEFRVRGTIGGNLIDYTGIVAANTADLTTIKLLLNSVVSDAEADWLTLDIKDFYLNTPLDRKEYMVIHSSQIPDAFHTEHDIKHLCNSKGYYLMEISKGIYGLPQAGKLAQDRLIKHLADAGYVQADNTACLFRHVSRPVWFTLVVDDFGIKYRGKQHAQHLIDTLTELYELHTDWTGAKYVGLDIAFNKAEKTVSISMEQYVQRALARFDATHLPGADSPCVYIPPKYGAPQQFTEVDTSPGVSEDRISRIRSIVGVFQWYARGVDPTILPALSVIASRQSTATEHVEELVLRLLNYLVRYPNAKIVYHASDMILCAHSDASYLCESMARSRAGGVIFFGYLSDGVTPNGSIECMSVILSTIVASVGEAEYAAIFKVAQLCENLRLICLDLGHPQPATSIICDNTCAVGIVNDTCKIKRLKAIDMRFHWVRDRVRQGHFTVTWQPGNRNLADFFTKPLAVYLHKQLKQLYIHSPAVLRKSS